MPQVGEIKQGQQIGRYPYSKWIWWACIDCGTERWVHIRGRLPANLRCNACAGKIKGKRWSKERHGEQGSNWKGGRIVTDAGYIKVLLQPDDFFYPMADHSGYVFEHRLVMAKHWGRCLHRWELVHHKGTKYPKGSKENRKDNRQENLQLVSDDRHKQITILENRINILEKRVTLLETENILLKTELQQGRGMRRPPSRYTRGGEV